MHHKNTFYPCNTVGNNQPPSYNSSSASFELENKKILLRVEKNKAKRVFNLCKNDPDNGQKLKHWHFYEDKTNPKKIEYYYIDHPNQGVKHHHEKKGSRYAYLNKLPVVELPSQYTVEVQEQNIGNPPPYTPPLPSVPTAPNLSPINDVIENAANIRSNSQRIVNNRYSMHYIPERIIVRERIENDNCLCRIS